MCSIGFDAALRLARSPLLGAETRAIRSLPVSHAVGRAQGPSLRALRAPLRAPSSRVRAGKASRGRLAARRRRIPAGLVPMLSFSLTGAIGCVLTTAADELTLAISSVLNRDGKPPRVVWVLCVAHEAELRAKILQHLREGDLVRIDGEIEQRRRQVGALALHSVGFVIHSIDRLPSPSEGGAA